MLKPNLFNGLSSVSSNIINGVGVLSYYEQRPIKYTHLLQAKGVKQNEEMVRGKSLSEWKRMFTT
jgi:fatty acyl-ACP thioesterase B